MRLERYTRTRSGQNEVPGGEEGLNKSHVPFLLGLGDEVVWAEGFGVKLQEVVEYVKVSSQIWIIITTL